MSSPAVTVVVPVGPYPANQTWLGDCLASVRAQEYSGRVETLLIDDMAGLKPDDLQQLHEPGDVVVTPMQPLDREAAFAYKLQRAEGEYLRPVAAIWRAPWRLGVAHAFNCGVALAQTDLVFMLGSDDLLKPSCIADCVQAWEQNRRRDGYYWVPIRYMDTGEEQGLACNAAMVTKGLWRETGGFAVETASGAPDAALVSMLMVHQPQALVKVGGKPLYEVRRHAGQDTAGRAPWQGVILATRGILTQAWQAPKWRRYYS